MENTTLHTNNRTNQRSRLTTTSTPQPNRAGSRTTAVRPRRSEESGWNDSVEVDINFRSRDLGPARESFHTGLRAFAGDDTQMSSPTAVDQSTPGGFVESLYDGLLARDSDPEGAAAWKANLESGQFSSAEVVKQFIQSEEFKSHDLDAKDTVGLLYETLLGRKADPGGLEFHAQNAENKGIGTVIDAIFASDEFKGRESEGKIKRSFAPEAPTPQPTPASPSSKNNNQAPAAPSETRSAQEIIQEDIDIAALDGDSAAIIDYYIEKGVAEVESRDRIERTLAAAEARDAERSRNIPVI